MAILIVGTLDMIVGTRIGSAVIMVIFTPFTGYIKEGTKLLCVVVNVAEFKNERRRKCHKKRGNHFSSMR